MEKAIIEALAQLGVAAVTFGMSFFMFYKFHMRLMDTHKQEREEILERCQSERNETRQAHEKQTDKVALAIEKLSDAIYRMKIT